jgi:hypothetical protein
MVFQDVSDKPLQTKDNVPVCSTTPDGMTTGEKRFNAASQEAPQERDEQPQQGRKGSMNLIFEIRPDVNGYLHRDRVRACPPCARPALPGPPGARVLHEVA